MKLILSIFVVICVAVSCNGLALPADAPIAPVDALIEAPVVAPVDALVDAPVDAAVQSSIVAAVEAAIAAAVNEAVVAPVVAPVITPVDTPIEAAVVAPVEAAVVAPVEAAVVAPIEAAVVAPVEAAVDAPVDAALDASVVAPVVETPLDAPTDRVARSISHKQARVFPGAVAIKKLVLLKFKKVIPISLILLKSSDENEAELVPVYPNSEIPADVQFIPTPNGISGHKDVQAIAIPSHLHAQLQMNGLANIENIEALLQDAEEQHIAEENKKNSSSNSNSVAKEDELLNVQEEDEDQLLESADQAEEEKVVKKPTSLRRVAVTDDIAPAARPSLKASAHTSVEQIPLYLYSAQDAPQVVTAGTGRKAARRHFTVGRRHYVA